MIVAYFSDRLRHRFSFAMVTSVIAMAAFGILLNVHGKENRHTQYGALFMLTCGCYSAMPIIVCWFAMNLGGHRRRSVGTAWQIGFGNSKSTPLRQWVYTDSGQLAGSFRLLPSRKKTPRSIGRDISSVFRSSAFQLLWLPFTSWLAGGITRSETGWKHQSCQRRRKR